MTKLIDALSARTRFGELMKRAEKDNTRFLVSRRGKPKVVILSVEDYLQNIVKESRLLTEIQQESKGAGLDQLSDKKIQAEISGFSKRDKKRLRR
jgi:prevent-host-death family protein